MPKGTRTITRIRKPKVDKLSPAPAGDPAEIDVVKVVILPREAFESGRGWVTYEGWDIYILRSSAVVDNDVRRRYEDGDIIHSDLIKIGTETWQVDGPPAPYDKGAIRKATRIRVKKVGTS